MKKTQGYPRVLYDYIPCQGGWDLNTPSLALPNGFVRDAINFEVSQTQGGGYRRVSGYERFDGRTSPSSATFTLVSVNETNTEIGQFLIPKRILGNVSLANGYLVWIGLHFFALTNVVGTFVAGETLFDIFGNSFGTVSSSTSVTPSSLENAEFLNASSEYYRGLITEVPGSGKILGVAELDVAGVPTVFAWRNNSAGTQCDIYKSTTAGWVQVPLYKVIQFSNASAQFYELDLLIQGPVNATIKRVVLESGSWQSGSASGHIIIDAIAGGSFAPGAATTSTASLTLDTVASQITIQQGGMHRIIKHNFRGQAETTRLYGCNGLQFPYEFDGQVFVPLNGANTAHDLVAHRNHLIFAVRSSMIGSGPGEPYQINASAGGFEIALGDTITNFLPQPGDVQSATLVVTTLSNVHTLYGTSSLDWSLVGQNVGVMGVPLSGGRMNQSYWLDDNGITNLRATQQFGNFNTATITNNVSSYIRERLALVVGAIVVPEKSQYRLYFSDRSALFCTIVNNRVFGVMPQKISHDFTTFWDGVAESKRIFAGGADGFIYELEKGTSFDGEPINAYVVFNWNTERAPRLLKRYRKAVVELQGGTYAAIRFGYSVSYGKAGVPQDTGRTYQASSGVASWDLVTWDNFYWDGSALSPTELEMRASGENLQLTFQSETDYIPSYTLNSIMVHYTPRRGLR